MSEFYNDDYEEKPIATLRYNWKRVVFSPWNLILIPATFGLYLVIILRSYTKLREQTYHVYPSWIEHIDKFYSWSGRTKTYQFDMIEKIDIEKGLFDGLFGTGRIKIKVRGAKFWNNFEMTHISDVDRAVKVLNNALNKYKREVKKLHD